MPSRNLALYLDKISSWITMKYWCCKFLARYLKFCSWYLNSWKKITNEILRTVNSNPPAFVSRTVIQFVRISRWASNKRINVGSIPVNLQIIIILRRIFTSWGGCERTRINVQSIRTLPAFQSSGRRYLGFVKRIRTIVWVTIGFFWLVRLEFVF